jgi:hypothetical protein
MKLNIRDLFPFFKKHNNNSISIIGSDFVVAIISHHGNKVTGKHITIREKSHVKITNEGVFINDEKQED